MVPFFPPGSFFGGSGFPAFRYQNGGFSVSEEVIDVPVFRIEGAMGVSKKNFPYYFKWVDEENKQ